MTPKEMVTFCFNEFVKQLNIPNFDLDVSRNMTREEELWYDLHDFADETGDFSRQDLIKIVSSDGFKLSNTDRDNGKFIFEWKYYFPRTYDSVTHAGLQYTSCETLDLVIEFAEVKGEICSAILFHNEGEEG